MDERAAKRDPYATFRFVVRWAGRPVAGLNQLSAVSGPIEGGAGVTHDAAFEAWARAGLASDPRPMRIDVLDLTGEVAMRYELADAWVSLLAAVPGLDAAATALVIEAITLESTGWQTLGSAP